MNDVRISTPNSFIEQLTYRLFTSIVITDEYRTHTSCISEAERYEKSIYRGSRKLDESGTGHRQQHTHQKCKKLSPQESWNETVQSAAKMAPPSLKNYMDQLAILENVPRKEKQFRNFTDNSLKLKGPKAETVKSEMWTLLMKVREEGKTEEQSTSAVNKVVDPAPGPSTATETKTAISGSDDEQATGVDTEYPSEKSVTKAIKKALKKASNKQLKFKALRKQVQSKFAFITDKSGKKKWEKILQNCVDANPKHFSVDGELVTLAK